MIHVERGGSAYGARLITGEPYTRGQLIYRIEGYHLVRQPTYQTIQVGQDTHIEELGVLAYLNHSCQPNTIVDTTGLTITAARDIAVGEELTFFYPSTEWEMDRPFVCLCGAPQCVRLVAGAKYLSIDTLSRYFVNQHIREMAQASLAQILNV
ncbi:MAG: SET domain-containing protein-lysine N-methyltransferase [Chloroflexi bacterium]|nr:SET domain-containing protein-lysine N-methyltransferase [Chloroflexota bacterium]